jgi:hypothetical protein
MCPGIINNFIIKYFYSTSGSRDLISIKSPREKGSLYNMYYGMEYITPPLYISVFLPKKLVYHFKYHLCIYILDNPGRLQSRCWADVLGPLESLYVYARKAPQPAQVCARWECAKSLCAVQLACDLNYVHALWRQMTQSVRNLAKLNFKGKVHNFSMSQHVDKLLKSDQENYQSTQQKIKRNLMSIFWLLNEKFIKKYRKNSGKK